MRHLHGVGERSVCSREAPETKVVWPCDAAVRCLGRDIHQATKNDPWNLRLGGFVTSETFIEAAHQAKEPKPKPKAASKRKVGHRIT